MFLTVLAACAAVFGCLMVSRRPLHYFQLESYQFPGYWKSCKRNKNRLLISCMLWPALWGAAVTVLGILGTHGVSLWVMIPLTAVVIAWQLLSAWRLQLKLKQTPEKKKFVVTARVKRLYGALTVVLLLVALFCAPLLGLLPLWVMLAGLIAWPVEKGIQRMYMRDAQRKMEAVPGLIRIGITGSYGKTSVKNMLYAILSQKYNVLSTPASFNTPMGLTRVLRERLDSGHQVFLAEMGARHCRDIRELTDFIHPTIGILTSVGPQHLDTFKTLENIISTKYDLVRALPAEGFAVFPEDGGICTDLYEKTAHVPRLIAGRVGGDAWAEDISVSARGSAFTLCFSDGTKIACETKMLGAHNISNILLCAATARRLGLTPAQIARGISQIKPVEHRLQLLDRTGSYTVIDDAFNANPAGAKRALEVLRLFPGRRVIVTPGMVELGAEEENYNRAFGRQMADCVDVAVLIGLKHTLPIREGLLESGFKEENIHSFASLNEATVWLRGEMRQGDYVLYENDLPDNYNE
ncbi:MAG: UDP-N-acetylmuramoyl-tripeptide--D-alanyl-D-alanine ligase [Clostridia bacterium]|nr:UDP-N-acetylmuramoyl-tripeptide--D-alanyl-D-alanine ligase [Clostridia bacterium]